MPVDPAHLDDETLALLALGAVEPLEAEPLERHLQECKECRERWAERLGEVALLAESADPAEPSPGIRGRLLERIASEPSRRRSSRPRPVKAAPAGTASTPTSSTPSDPSQKVPTRTVSAPAGPGSAKPGRATPDRAPPTTATPARAGGTTDTIDRAPGRGGPAMPWLALAAALLIGALLGAWTARTFLADGIDRASVEAEQLQEELATARREIDRLQGDLGSARDLIALTAAREAVGLAGQEAAPEAHGRVFIDRAGGRALFVAGDLPPLSEQRVFQLWRIVDGQPVPAGLLDPQEAEGILVERVDGTTGETWTVTEEPAGGVPAPTGRMVLSS